MEINTKIKFVEGSFDTETGKLICIPHKKYGEVNLCFKTDNLHVPFAKIKLHSRDVAVDADAVFEDACKLGEEIARRWNEFQILNNRTQSERDWKEDFSHENGNYENKCIRCGNTFFGHKRRVTCKICADGNPKFNNDNEKSE